MKTPMPPFAVALVEAHRADLARALGVDPATEWDRLLELVREHRSKAQHDYPLEAVLGPHPIEPTC